MAQSHAIQDSPVTLKEKTRRSLIENKNDQYMLSWINSTLSEGVLATIYGLNTYHQVWLSLPARFASCSQSRAAHLKRQL